MVNRCIALAYCSMLKCLSFSFSFIFIFLNYLYIYSSKEKKTYYISSNSSEKCHHYFNTVQLIFITEIILKYHVLNVSQKAHFLHEGCKGGSFYQIRNRRSFVKLELILERKKSIYKASIQRFMYTLHFFRFKVIRNARISKVSVFFFFLA